MAARGPPLDLVRSSWRPLILDFVQRASRAWGAEPGVTLTSFYRDPQFNRTIGGAPRSQHQVALAADFAGERTKLRHLAQHARAVGLIAVDEGSHLHIQFFRAGVGPRL